MMYSLAGPVQFAPHAFTHIGEGIELGTEREEKGGEERLAAKGVALLVLPAEMIGCMLEEALRDEASETNRNAA
jgi:hypothetical protein